MPITQFYQDFATSPDGPPTAYFQGGGSSTILGGKLIVNTSNLNDALHRPAGETALNQIVTVLTSPNNGDSGNGLYLALHWQDSANFIVAGYESSTVVIFELVENLLTVKDRSASFPVSDSTAYLLKGTVQNGVVTVTIADNAASGTAIRTATYDDINPSLQYEGGSGVSGFGNAPRAIQSYRVESNDAPTPPPTGNGLNQYRLNIGLGIGI